MQYSFRLPTDYDMERIRTRIREKGTSCDGLAGLVQKGFLYNETGTDWVGQPTDNEYAPYYIWQSAEAMRDFLLSDWFANLCRAFGRPIVRSWPVVQFNFGAVANPAEKVSSPAFVLRETIKIADSVSVTAALETERKIHQEALHNPQLYNRALAFDSERWEIVRFSLLQGEPAPARIESASVDAHSYQLLYLAV